MCPPITIWVSNYKYYLQLRIYPQYESTPIIYWYGSPIINTGLRLGAYPQYESTPIINTDPQLRIYPHYESTPRL